MSKNSKTPSAAPGGVPTSTSEQPAQALQVVAPGTFIPSDEDLDLDTPLILSKKSVTQCYELTVEQCEEAICKAMFLSEEHRKQSAFWDLRTGVLFQIYKQALNVAGRKYTGFWDKAEKRFGVGRATISKKMRLAAIWAKEQGASEEQIRQLAEAADLEDTSLPAIQMALDFIGDKTTTDLYREHKLVATGPTGGYRPTKADGSPRADKRTDAEIKRDALEAQGRHLCSSTAHWIDKTMLLSGPEEERSWDLLDDARLEELKLKAYDFYQGILTSQNRRKALRK